MNPAQHVDGVGQMACASATDPCTTRAFIGDYFGLAISKENVYALFVSTHYPSGVTADEGGPVYYQQQVLSTVPRSAIPGGFCRRHYRCTGDLIRSDRNGDAAGTFCLRFSISAHFPWFVSTGRQGRSHFIPSIYDNALVLLQPRLPTHRERPTRS
jgi:hypothetical protein